MIESAHRVLVIDDNPWIHDDVRKVLAHREEDAELVRLERELAGPGAPEPPDRAAQLRFEIDSALQGRDGVEAARRARGDGRPYAIAFVDIRMPPGWDGIQTIERLWEVDPDVQAVICSAYSDYSWNAIQRRIGGTDRLLVLKKPFEAIEVAQLAHTLARKWSLQRAERGRAEELEALVLASTSELARAGQLAAGIASELGAPLRNVTESLQHLRSSFGALDLASLSAAIPPTLDAALDSLRRIEAMLHAAREFGRDDRSEHAAIDLDRGLRTTLEVSRHAYGAVADIELDIGELPPVLGVASELNLVLLNLIVSAAHAISSAPATGRRGTIRISTSGQGGEALITIASTGTGLPPSVRTGHGLAIARSLIMKHGGSLTFETEPDRGTTFMVRLPAGRAPHPGAT